MSVTGGNYNPMSIQSVDAFRAQGQAYSDQQANATSLPTFTVTLNRNTGTTIASVNGTIVSYNLGSGSGAMLDQISGDWNASRPSIGTLAGHSAAVGYSQAVPGNVNAQPTAAAPNNTAGRDPDIGPDGVRYVGPMLPPDRGGAVTNALLLGNTVTGVNGTLLYGASQVTKDVVAREILERVGGKIGVAGFLFATANIAHSGFGGRNTPDLIMSAVGLVPGPWTQGFAAGYTVVTTTWDLTHLPPLPELQTYRPPPDPDAPSPQYRQ